MIRRRDGITQWLVSAVPSNTYDVYPHRYGHDGAQAGVLLQRGVPEPLLFPLQLRVVAGSDLIERPAMELADRPCSPSELSNGMEPSQALHQRAPLSPGWYYAPASRWSSLQPNQAT